MDAETSDRRYEGEAVRRRHSRTITTSFCVLALALTAGCSSSSKTTSLSTTTSTVPSAPTTPAPDANLIPNQIPFNVGERMGLPNGWLVEITKVHRPFVPTGLPAAPTGRQYVAVDVTMQYNETAPQNVEAASLYTVVDGAGRPHPVVAPSGAGNGIDGRYSTGTTHSGQLVFVVPVGKTLRMILDGPKIGTQRSIFQVDPPRAPSQD